MSETSRAIDHVASALRPLLAPQGFRKRSRQFSRTSEDSIHVIHVQGSMWGDGRRSSFTVNLGLYYPRIADLRAPHLAAVEGVPAYDECHVRARLGDLMPGGEDRWWDMQADEPVQATAGDVADAIEHYALPWFEAHTTLRPDLNFPAQVFSTLRPSVLALALGRREEAAALLPREVSGYASFNEALADEWNRWGAQHGLLRV